MHSNNEVALAVGSTHPHGEPGDDAQASAEGAGEAKAGRPKVLVVDDDPAFRLLSTMALKEAGIEHLAVSTAREALNSMQNAGGKPFELILLDLELPGMKGWELLKLLRENGCDVPVVLVTVCESVAEKVRGLDLGADDYVVKPCSFDELLWRLQAVLRRTLRRGRLRVGDLDIDPLLRRVRRQGKPIELTPREYELLSLLAAEPGRTLTKTELVWRVWKLDSEPNTNFLQVHFSRLRQKLEPMRRARIETVHGVGYRLVVEPAVSP